MMNDELDLLPLVVPEDLAAWCRDWRYSDELIGMALRKRLREQDALLGPESKAKEPDPT